LLPRGHKGKDSAGVLSLRACLTDCHEALSMAVSYWGDGSRFGFLRLTAPG